MSETLSRRTLWWRVRFVVGWRLQSLAWRFSDPHDAWVVDYYIDDAAHSEVIHGFHHMARAKARELKGKIVGHSAITIPAGDEPNARDGADWWKR